MNIDFSSPQFRQYLVKGVLILGFRDAALKIISAVANKFIELEKIPIQMHYVGKWPAFCKKAREIGSTFWNRRFEAATASSFTFTGLLASSYTPTGPLQKPYELGSEATAYLLNKCSSGWSAKDEMMWVLTLVSMSNVVGAGAGFALGLYDLGHQFMRSAASPTTKPIFNADLEKDINEIIQFTTTTKDEGGAFQNLLLYGPPGTGKTSTAKYIAEQSGMNYAFTSGGKLVTNTVKNEKETIDSVEGFKKFMTHVKSLKTPTIIFVDEAEVLCASREALKKKNPIASALLAEFLNETSTPSPQVMWVLATNLKDQVDDAVLDRCRCFHLGLPEVQAREKIVQDKIPVIWPDAKKRPVISEEVA